MNQAQAENEERNILTAKNSAFKGTGRVLIRSIRLTDHHSRDIDEKNIKRLEQIFEKGGCFRLEQKYHVPVLVTEEELQLASLHSISDNLSPYPFLEFRDGALRCLQGRHRLLAASEYLDPVDQWWIVEFYVNANESLMNHISRDFENSSNISDGEIWRHIRICNRNGDDVGERIWWSRLTRSKERDLRQLLRHFGFCQAFDQLIDIPGLWVGLQLGALHRFLSLKCDEELLHYLHYIHDVWSGIFAGHPEMMKAADGASVNSLELRAPNSSRRDLAEVRFLMESGKLLPSVQDKQIRGEILQNILATNVMIPSISTFFGDLIHFYQLADAMKKLVEPIKKSATNTSVYRAFRRAFAATSGNELFEIQVNEGVFQSIQGDLHTRMEVGYRQLWMYTMRHFPELVSGATPRKENKQSKPPLREPNPNAWFEFAGLAHRVGFDSAEIRARILENPDRKIALGFLSNARPLETYSYDKQSIEEGAEKISKVLEAFKKKKKPAPVPTLTAERLPITDIFSRRCGRPFQFDYERDRGCFFFNNFHREYNESHAKEDISSFYVRRAFYFAFFGNISLEGSRIFVQSPLIQPEEIPDPQSGPLQSDHLQPEANIQIGPPQADHLQPEADTQTGPLQSNHLQFDIPTGPLQSDHLQPEADIQTGPEFDDLDMLESPESVDIEMEEGSETGRITVKRGGKRQTFYKARNELSNTIQKYLGSRYRCVNTRGFLVQGTEKYLMSKPRHIHLKRSDIAAKGTCKNKESPLPEGAEPQAEQNWRLQLQQQEEKQRLQEAEQQLQLQRQEAERQAAELEAEQSRQEEDRQARQNQRLELQQQEEKNRLQLQRQEAERQAAELGAELSRQEEERQATERQAEQNQRLELQQQEEKKRLQLQRQEVERQAAELGAELSRQEEERQATEWQAEQNQRLELQQQEEKKRLQLQRQEVERQAAELEAELSRQEEERQATERQAEQNQRLELQQQEEKKRLQLQRQEAERQAAELEAELSRQEEDRQATERQAEQNQRLELQQQEEKKRLQLQRQEVERQAAELEAEQSWQEEERQATERQAEQNQRLELQQQEEKKRLQLQRQEAERQAAELEAEQSRQEEGRQAAKRQAEQNRKQRLQEVEQQLQLQRQEAEQHAAELEAEQGRQEEGQQAAELRAEQDRQAKVQEEQQRGSAAERERHTARATRRKQQQEQQRGSAAGRERHTARATRRKQQQEEQQEEQQRGSAAERERHTARATRRKQQQEEEAWESANETQSTANREPRERTIQELELINGEIMDSVKIVLRHSNGIKRTLSKPRSELAKALQVHINNGYRFIDGSGRFIPDVRKYLGSQPQYIRLVDGSVATTGSEHIRDLS